MEKKSYYPGRKSTFTWGKNSFVHKIQINWFIFFHQYFVYDFLPQLWLLPFAAALIRRTLGGILPRLDSRLFMRFFQSFDWGHATKIFYFLSWSGAGPTNCYKMSVPRVSSWTSQFASYREYVRCLLRLSKKKKHGMRDFLTMLLVVTRSPQS